MSDIPERDGRSEEGEKEPLWQSEGKIPEAQRRRRKENRGLLFVLEVDTDVDLPPS